MDHRRPLRLRSCLPGLPGLPRLSHLPRLPGLSGFARFPGIALLVLALCATACGKPDDLPRKREEILATGRSYQGHFDELKRRIDDLDPRIRALNPATLNLAATQERLALVRTMVDQNRAYAQQVPTMLQTWSKSDDLREHQKLLDGMRQRLEAGVIEATDEISAIESWTALAEQQPRGQPVQPVSEPPIEDRNPVEGSAAPVR